MPNTTQQQLIERIHASGKQLVLSITGGGSGAVAALLEVPGASASVLEAVVPYAAAALQQWLGGPVDHFCSERTARTMAMRAFERARELVAAGGPVAAATEPPIATLLRGIGATASLASTRAKRGAHRIHVAWQSADTTSVVTCELRKGERTRAEEEQVATQLVLQAVAEACGIDESTVIVSALGPIRRRVQHAPTAWTELLLGKRDAIDIGVQQEVKHHAARVIFPGAFNPLHSGHVRMAEVATERYGGPVTFELSIANVDKPPLDFVELADRLEQLAGRHVLLTRAATFAEKARLVPGCVFIVGADTLQRICEAHYYGKDLMQRDSAIDEIAALNCRFLVFGRTAGDDFITLKNLELPAPLRALCDYVSEDVFREDVSSTKLRVGES